MLIQRANWQQRTHWLVTTLPIEGLTFFLFVQLIVIYRMALVVLSLLERVYRWFKRKLLHSPFPVSREIVYRREREGGREKIRCTPSLASWRVTSQGQVRALEALASPADASRLLSSFHGDGFSRFLTFIFNRLYLCVCLMNCLFLLHFVLFKILSFFRL